MIPLPEQGQLVRVRERHYLVQDVIPGNVERGAAPMHRVRLEGVDDDALGEALEVIWEHEVHPSVHDALGVPRPDAWDPLRIFDAFIHATRWTLTSVLDGLPLQAPFRGNIRIEDYQLEPVVRALRMPRVSLLIADDVGLGKTIEAGLVMQELLARQRVRRVLILCPASLQKQWAEEMQLRFSLRFEIVDRDYVQRVRKEYGSHVNAWMSYPRLIASMDFLKREAPLLAFRASLKSGRGALRDWDLLILDEAHNVAPTGRGGYVRDSDRTVMVREIKDCFEHRLFLTATPHNGFTESFTALLEMLDPIRFSRGPDLDRSQLDAVMVRRLKEGVCDAMGRRVFPKREVNALPVALEGTQAALLDLLDAYMRLRLARSGGADTFAVRFALVMLKRRFLSSPRAFAHSMSVHHSHLRSDEAPEADASTVIAALQQKLAEDHDDDDEKEQAEETALIETARFFRVTDEEYRLADRMHALARDVEDAPDAKAHRLLAWIRAQLAPDTGWNQERLLVFSEFRDTVDYLRALLDAAGWGDRVLLLTGGMPSAQREAVKEAFRATPDDGEGRVRVLLATDAAAEGLNLQAHCRHLLHYDIPWNPNRMEQRNGRIDRHGQEAKDVWCHHFAFTGREDYQFLQTVVDKVRTMRADLGAVGDVIAQQVEEAMLGRRRTWDEPKPALQRVRDEVRAQVMQQEQVRELQRAWKDARRSLGLTRENLHAVVEGALVLEGRGRLVPVDDPSLAGRAWVARDLPPSWSDARAALHDRKGTLLKVVFDEADGRGRPDTVLVHLDHPLMRRALGVFRANLWAAGLHDSHRLQRVSYRVLDDADLDRPMVVAFARLVCAGTSGARLHEELFAVGGEIADRSVSWVNDEQLRALLACRSSHPSIPTALGADLRARFPAHERALRERIESDGGRRAAEARKALQQKATGDARAVRQLIDQRIKEIEKTLKTLDAELASAQLRLWPAEQLDQHKTTIGYLGRRLEQLRGERETQPEEVRSRYALREPRSFPVGLLYLLPQGMVR
jgi:ERCC4-related helicase